MRALYYVILLMDLAANYFIVTRAIIPVIKLDDPVNGLAVILIILLILYDITCIRWAKRNY